MYENTKEKKFLFYFLNCTSQVDNSDCGDGLLDGSLYKEVIFLDIPKLNNIAINAEIGESTRFKMDVDRSRNCRKFLLNFF